MADHRSQRLSGKVDLAGLKLCSTMEGNGTGDREWPEKSRFHGLLLLKIKMHH